MSVRNTSRRSRNPSRPTSANSQGASDVLTGIIQNTVGNPSRNSGPTPWTGPITRSRARNMLRDSSRAGTAGPVGMAFHQENNALQEQNLQVKRGGPGGMSLMSAPSASTETISSSDSHHSRSCPTTTQPPHDIAGPSCSGDNPASSSMYKHLATPRPQPTPRMDLLETLVRTFPLTVPEEDIHEFLDPQKNPGLTIDLKRYFMSEIARRKSQRRKEQENQSSVFKSECPWEPKWYTNFLMKLIVSTKARPNITEYILDARQRDPGSSVLQRWKGLTRVVKWTVGLGTALLFMTALSFLIDTYGEEGVTVSVPLILFINVVLNKALYNMSSALPSGI